MLEIYQEIEKSISKGEIAVLATVIASTGSTPRKAGAKMLIKSDFTLLGTIGGGYVENEAIQKAKEIMKSGKSEIMHFDLAGTGREASGICGGQMDIFLERIVPRETLIIFGGGHIAQSVAQAAKTLGFRIVVMDPRPKNNNVEQFPDADLLLVDGYEKISTKLTIDEYCYIVICTQTHTFDEQCLEYAIGTRAKYIGMIGSKKKVKEIRERLSQKGIPQDRLDKVCAPIGLPINAETPAEIAVSIVAEIIKIRRFPG